MRDAQGCAMTLVIGLRTPLVTVTASLSKALVLLLIIRSLCHRPVTSKRGKSDACSRTTVRSSPVAEHDRMNIDEEQQLPTPATGQADGKYAAA